MLVIAGQTPNFQNIFFSKFGIKFFLIPRVKPGISANMCNIKIIYVIFIFSLLLYIGNIKIIYVIFILSLLLYCEYKDNICNIYIIFAPLLRSPDIFHVLSRRNMRS